MTAAAENKDMKHDDPIENTTVAVSTSLPKLTSSATLSTKPAFGLSSDTLVTRTSESKGSNGFDGPTKKYASTGTLFSFGINHEKPVSAMVSDLEAQQKMQDLPTSTTVEPTDVQTILKDVKAMSSSGDAIDREKPGNIANFRRILVVVLVQMVFRKYEKNKMFYQQYRLLPI